MEDNSLNLKILEPGMAVCLFNGETKQVENVSFEENICILKFEGEDNPQRYFLDGYYSYVNEEGIIDFTKSIILIYSIEEAKKEKEWRINLAKNILSELDNKGKSGYDLHYLYAKPIGIKTAFEIECEQKILQSKLLWEAIINDEIPLMIEPTQINIEKKSIFSKLFSKFIYRRNL